MILTANREALQIAARTIADERLGLAGQSLHIVSGGQLSRDETAIRIPKLNPRLAAFESDGIVNRTRIGNLLAIAGC